MKLFILLFINILTLLQLTTSLKYAIKSRAIKFPTKLCVSHDYSINNGAESNDSLQLEIDLRKERREKLIKRWATGLSLGALGTVWIFSGKGFFTLGFLIASFLAQNEYYEMVKAAGKRAGLRPASKTGNLSALLCYVTAGRLMWQLIV